MKGFAPTSFGLTHPKKEPVPQRRNDKTPGDFPRGLAFTGKERERTRAVLGVSTTCLPQTGQHLAETVQTSLKVFDDLFGKVVGFG